MENVQESKVLGTILQNNLKWDSNTAHIVKRANSRLVLLRKLSEFGAPTEDLKTIYISYIRSVLEQSAVVWHTSLTTENISDLERVQKSAIKIILKNRYQDYQNALQILDLEDLVQRRNNLCKSFAKQSVKNASLHFESNDKLHTMITRYTNEYEIEQCHTERFRMSALS